MTGTLWSVGGVYEIPMGSSRSLQAVGDGEFIPVPQCWSTLCDGNAHWLSTFGYRLPVDEFVQTSAIHWSNQFDVRMTKTLYLLSGFAWWHWVDDAQAGLPIGVGGMDLFNLPTTNVTGADMLTQNVGMKYKPCGNFEAGVAYEFPLSQNHDVIDIESDGLDLPLLTNSSANPIPIAVATVLATLQRSVADAGVFAFPSQVANASDGSCRSEGTGVHVRRR